MAEYILLNGVNSNADVDTSAVDLREKKAYSAQVIFTGADVVGALVLKGSLDNSTFTTLTGTEQAVAASASHLWNMPAEQYRYFKVSWDYTSGTGNITVRVLVKE